MKNMKIKKENLTKLLKDLRKEDREEIEYYFKEKTEEQFIKTCLKAKEKYFLSDYNNHPIAIGGVERLENKNYKVGQVWLICSNNNLTKSFKFIKYVKNKIKKFKEEYDILFNVIYKSNYKALDWINKCGFKILDINNDNFKLFYLTKGGINFDLRYITGK